MTQQDYSRLRDELNEDIYRAVEKSIKTLVQEQQFGEDRLRKVVREEIRAAQCVCPVTDEQKKAIPPLFNMLNDFGRTETGNPDLGRGVLELRKNHVWTSRMRNNTSRWGNTIVTVGIIGVVGAIIALILATIGFDNDLP